MTVDLLHCVNRLRQCQLGGVILQEYLSSHLPELINKHVFCDNESVLGDVIVELGRAETYLTKCSRGQTGQRHTHSW